MGVRGFEPPATNTGKIELFSDNLERRFGFGIPRFEPVAKEFRLTLITPSSTKHTNTTFSDCMDSDGFDKLESNPADAKVRSLSDGDKVIDRNDLGQVMLQIVVTDATRTGVLYSPKGIWCRTSATGMMVNALIPSDIRTDIEDDACYNETFVEIDKH